MEELDKQVNNKPQRDENGRLLPGNTANPNGRPKGKTLKEWQAEQFRMMTDEEKQKWVTEQKVSGEIRWKMAEGMPRQDLEHSGKLTIAEVIKGLKDEGTTGQRMEDEQPLQDTGQEEESNQVPPQQSSGTLQPTQVVEKYNPKE
jgi:hypothetical protein